MSSKAALGTLAIAVLTLGGSVIACGSGSMPNGNAVGSDPNSGIPNSDGVPNGGSVPSGDGTTTGDGTSGRPNLFSVLSPCDNDFSSKCSQQELDGFSDCIRSQCASQLQTCYGSSFDKGTFGGACGDAMTCGRACGCDDSSCSKKCKESDDCKSCQNTLVQCLTQCVPSCAKQSGPITTPVTPDDAGTSTTPTTSGKTCADLSACCNAKPDSDPIKSSCLEFISSSPTDAQCSQVYSAASCTN